MQETGGGVEVVSRFLRLLMRVRLQGHRWWFGSNYFLFLLGCTKVTQKKKKKEKEKKKKKRMAPRNISLWNRLPLILGDDGLDAEHWQLYNQFQEMSPFFAVLAGETNVLASGVSRQEAPCRACCPWRCFYFSNVIHREARQSTTSS